MDEFKPLIDIVGTPALIRLLESIKASGLKRAVVVTGHKHSLIDEALANRFSSSDPNSSAAASSSFASASGGYADISADCSSASYSDVSNDIPADCSYSSAPGVSQDAGNVPFCLDTVYNADYESGMFSSVKAGIRCITENQRANCGGEKTSFDSSEEEGALCAALLFPVDVPLVSAGTIRGLIAAYEAGDPSRFAVPVYKEKNGHPLLIPREYFSEIIAFTGEGGLKEIRNKRLAEMLRYEVSDAGCVLDMDTPGDYKKLLAYEKGEDYGG